MTFWQAPRPAPVRVRRRASMRRTSLRRASLRWVGGYGAAFLLSMAVFSAPPFGRAPAGAAIVRIANRRPGDPFEPGEVVAGDLVLTLPLAATPGAETTRRSLRNSPN